MSQSAVMGGSKKLEEDSFKFVTPAVQHQNIKGNDSTVKGKTKHTKTYR